MPPRASAQNDTYLRQRDELMTRIFAVCPLGNPWVCYLGGLQSREQRYRTASEGGPPRGRGCRATRQQADPDRQGPAETAGAASGGAAPSAVPERGLEGGRAEERRGRECAARSRQAPELFGTPCLAGPGAWSPTSSSPVRGGATSEGGRRRGTHAGSCALRGPGRQRYAPPHGGRLGLGSVPRCPAGPRPPSGRHPPAAHPGREALKSSRLWGGESERRSKEGVMRRSEEGSQ
ncbi:hypothetical protein NDU88_000621 [Pleurodeles waltl]|uniref:Uncharacterized protein n=1 Tax=Pleurodeles waltl TaxID=8319 RepID=A0AAV7S6M7_PLEWA|nr:hypothetical protein NDU88_000621 [Pleurodeles waltl]